MDYKKIRDIELKLIGERAKQFRMFLLRKTQREVANELGTDVWRINFFENGKLDSAYILKYYIDRGLKI